MPFDYNIYERALRGGQTVGHNLAMTRVLISAEI